MTEKALSRFYIPDSVIKNINAIADIPDNVRNSIGDILCKKDESIPLRYKEVKSLADELGLARQRLSRTIFSTCFLATIFHECEQDIDGFLEELVQILNYPDDDKRSAIESYLRKIVTNADTLTDSYRQYNVAGTGAPNFYRIERSASLKPALSRPFRYGHDKVIDYKPTVTSLVPIAQLNLENSDSNSTFTVEVDEDSLDQIISELLTLQLEMKELRQLSSKLQT